MGGKEDSQTTELFGYRPIHYIHPYKMDFDFKPTKFFTLAHGSLISNADFFLDFFLLETKSLTFVA